MFITKVSHISLIGILCSRADAFAMPYSKQSVHYKDFNHDDF